MLPVRRCAVVVTCQQNLVASMMLSPLVLTLSTLLPALSGAQRIRSDPGVAGPALEIVHLYNDQWPTGTNALWQRCKFMATNTEQRNHRIERRPQVLELSGRPRC